jgi:casein kinase II subunit beta
MDAYEESDSEEEAMRIKLALKEKLLLRKAAAKKLKLKIKKPHLEYINYYEESDEINYYEGGFIRWFCRIQGNGFLVEPTKEFISDPFNLVDFKEMPEFATMLTRFEWEDALKFLLCHKTPSEKDLEDHVFQEIFEHIQDLFGLIHARFLVSHEGLQQLKIKFINRDYGSCERVACDGSKMLPIGQSSELGEQRVKVYCPIC